jgi:hypothetical protein
VTNVVLSKTPFGSVFESQHDVLSISTADKIYRFSPKLYLWLPSQELPVHNRILGLNFVSVLRIRIGFNADPNPDYYLNADPDPDPGPNQCGSKLIPIRYAGGRINHRCINS